MWGPRSLQLCPPSVLNSSTAASKVSSNSYPCRKRNCPPPCSSGVYKHESISALVLLLSPVVPNAYGALCTNCPLPIAQLSGPTAAACVHATCVGELSNESCS